MSTLSERWGNMAPPIENWRGTKEFGESLQAVQDALKSRVPEDIAIAMANLQGFIDWFQVDNHIDLDPNRIEAEYNRWEERFESKTAPFQWFEESLDRMS